METVVETSEGGGGGHSEWGESRKGELSQRVGSGSGGKAKG